MERSPVPVTVEQKILAALARIEKQAGRYGASSQSRTTRPKPGQKNSTGVENFKLTHYSSLNVPGGVGPRVTLKSFSKESRRSRKRPARHRV
jgi:hypothetical protein